MPLFHITLQEPGALSLSLPRTSPELPDIIPQKASFRHLHAHLIDAWYSWSDLTSPLPLIAAAIPSAAA